MKSKIFAVLSFFGVIFGIILCLTQKICAETKSEFPILFEEGDFKYTLNEDNRTVTVEEYIGYETDVVIPDMIDGKSVVSVAYKQGFERKLIKSITIPDSVEKIEEHMFLAYCDESMFDPGYITDIYVSDNNKFFSSEDGILYNKDKTELIKCPRGRQGEISNLSENLKRIGTNAFEDCKNLIHIELPDAIVSIESGAFCGCDGLESIKLPENLKQMGQSVFFNCTSLKALKLPNGLEHIQSRSFGGCTSLREIELPEKLNCIDDSVFSSHEGFRDIHYPKDKASWNKIQIGDYNDALKKIDIQMGYQELEDGTVEITDGCSFLKDNCVTIPEEIGGKRVVSIGDSAFRDYKSLEKIHLPEKIKKIGDGAFYGCNNLEQIKFPNDLESVGEEAFYECTSLESIAIPGEIVKIGRSAFHKCKNLKDVYYTKSKGAWNMIFISSYNDALTAAKIHYLSTQPMQEKDPLGNRFPVK